MTQRKPQTTTAPDRLRCTLALLRLLFLVIGMAAAILGLDLNFRDIRENGPGLRQPAQPLTALPYLGITIDKATTPHPERRVELNQLHAAGIGWVRQRLDWAMIEPFPGEFDWHGTDALLADIVDSGLIPMVVLDGSPAWARARWDQEPADNPLAPPLDPAVFARFAAAVARRYGHVVTVYQIWDEPNIAPHWGARHVEPVHYAQLLRTAAAAIRQTDGDAVIVAAALAPTTDRGHTAMDEVRFLQRMHAAGALAAVDAVAIQPFGFGHPARDTRRRLTVLNFQRAALVRRVLVAGGADHLPVIAVRFGWNDRPSAPWRTVLEPQRSEFVADALAVARQNWPWLVGAAWAIDRPASPPSDPIWGFAADRRVLAALREGTEADPTTARDSANHLSWLSVTLGLVALPIMAWRGGQAAALLPWWSWRGRLKQRPGLYAALWAMLLALYFVSTWPPLILICLGLAAMLISVRPLSALWLASFLLPLHIYHKELHVAAGTIYLPPAQAVLLAALPVLAAASRRRVPMPTSTRWRQGDRLAAAWLAIGIASACHVWHWPGYIQGSVDLILTPLTLYGLTRLYVHDRAGLVTTALALFGGGVLASLFGLVAWMSGAGTVADGLRRLVGPHFSPNHTALYLERTLFLGTALAIGVRQLLANPSGNAPTASATRSDARSLSRKLRRAVFTRRGAGLAAALGGATVVVGGALLLTASRGAWVLGVPVGATALVWLARASSHGPRRIYRTGQAVVGLLIVAILVWAAVTAWPRLANTVTVAERLSIWQASWTLWQAFPIFGTGAGGFYWRFPAYIPINTAIDPNLRHPHNLWLESLTGWGALGGVWLAWLLATLIAWARKIKQGFVRPDVGSWLAAGLLAGLAAAVAHGQVDAFLALPDLAGWNWMALALMVQVGVNKKGRPARI